MSLWRPRRPSKDRFQDADRRRQAVRQVRHQPVEHQQASIVRAKREREPIFPAQIKFAGDPVEQLLAVLGGDTGPDHAEQHVCNRHHRGPLDLAHAWQEHDAGLLPRNKQRLQIDRPTIRPLPLRAGQPSAALLARKQVDWRLRVQPFEPDRTPASRAFPDQPGPVPRADADPAQQPEPPQIGSLVFRQTLPADIDTPAFPAAQLRVCPAPACEALRALIITCDDQPRSVMAFSLACSTPVRSAIVASLRRGD